MQGCIFIGQFGDIVRLVGLCSLGGLVFAVYGVPVLVVGRWYIWCGCCSGGTLLPFYVSADLLD